MLLHDIIKALEAELQAHEDLAAKRERVVAGIDQDPFDEEEFVERIREIGRLTRAAGALSPGLREAVEDVVEMIPLGAPIDEVWQHIMGEYGDFADAQEIIGEILNAAHDARFKAIDTPSERASEICLDILQSAYDEAKQWGVLLMRDEPDDEAR